MPSFWRLNRTQLSGRFATAGHFCCRFSTEISSQSGKIGDIFRTNLQNNSLFSNCLQNPAFSLGYRGTYQILSLLAIIGHSWRTVLPHRHDTSYLILKVDSLSAGKKAVFTSEEVCLARTAVNQLRNKKIQQRKHTDATDDMLYQLENAGLRQR